MTKYIINSGGAKNNPEGFKKSIAETLKGLGNNPKILFCMFAQPREDWGISYQEKVEGFKSMVPEGVEPVFAMALPDKFVEQTKEADVIVILGGDDHLIQYWLSKFDLKKLFDGKVVAGGSAGSDVLVKHFWTCDWRQCMDGLGILPIKFIPHYQSAYGADDPRGSIDWNKAYQELENYEDKSLPIHALKEGEFIVIKQ